MTMQLIQSELKKAGLDGVRTEINRFVQERDACATGAMQTEFVARQRRQCELRGNTVWSKATHRDENQ